MVRYIVDGYNVVHVSDRYRSLADSDLDAARARLVEDVASFCPGEGRCVIVFDGAGNPSSDGTPHHVAGVTVIFSAAGESADTVIEALAARGRDRGEQVIVVTSDAATQWTVMRAGVARMSAREFSERLAEHGGEWREHAPTGSLRGHLEERIDADVRRRLARWARGDLPD
ncbi:MAG: NYN domain-containing protein [Anaerosomatales bacterium]|nr:NYN domain-containing protein [Anaerosomatales bacterium]